MKRLLLLLLLVLVAGCSEPPPPPDLDQTRQSMNQAFEALEMYSFDHQGYPDSLTILVEKEFLEKVPPSLSYSKTEDGFLLKAAGDYSAYGADSGFPQMDQDGTFALRPSDFPTLE